MVDKIDFKITGLENLKRKFNAVSNDVKYKGGRSALRKAARAIVDDIKSRAEIFDDPETVRSIKDNVDLRWNSRYVKTTGDLAFKIGILGGANSRTKLVDAKKAPTPYWRQIEFGNEKTPARPFVRPSLSEGTAAVTEIFVKAYEKALDKAIAKAQKGGK